MNIIEFWKKNGPDNIQVPEDAATDEKLEQLLAQFPFNSFYSSSANSGSG